MFMYEWYMDLDRNMNERENVCCRVKRGKKVKKKIHSTLKRDLEARAKSEHYRWV